MDQSTAGQIDISAILNTYVYMDHQKGEYTNKSLSWILDNMPDDVKKKSDYKAVLKAVNENPELGKMKLIDQSICSGFSEQQVISCAFQDPNGNLYVAYRGTGDGKWVDNGVGIANESSLMQQKAEEYFEYLVKTHNLTNYDEGKIFVTGHSKGGNQAQYVTLNSKYGYLIDNCYSIDGQGFSKEAVKHFIEEHGEDYYKAQLQKMFSVNGENDYVHGLGIRVIPEENTYYIKTDGAEGFGGYHDIKEMLDGDGINWIYKDGRIISADQGPMGELAYVISEKMQEMDTEDMEDSAVTVMSLLEFCMSYKNEDGEDVMGGKYKVGTGDIKFASVEEIMGFLGNGLPLILETLVTTEEGRDVAVDFIKSFISDVYKDKGIPGVVGLAFVATVATPIVTTLVGGLIFVGKIYDTVTDFIDSITDLAKNIKNWFSNLKEGIKKTVNKIIDKVKSWTPGGRYSVANPQIKVDTYKLRSYASRLNDVNRRIKNLDGRLDGLYWKVGLLDLWSLMQADLLTGYSWRLSRATSYLNDTASDFDTIERELANC